MGYNLWVFHQVLCSAPHEEGGSPDILAHGLLETVWQGLDISEELPGEQGHGLGSSALAALLPLLAGQPHHWLLSSTGTRGGSGMQARTRAGWSPVGFTIV